jgi:hypothetical protein
MPYPDEPEPPRSELLWAIITVAAMLAAAALAFVLVFH